jgi:hypothetical protein
MRYIILMLIGIFLISLGSTQLGAGEENWYWYLLSMIGAGIIGTIAREAYDSDK